MREAEFDRPMTKAQKAEYMREKAAELRRQGKEIPPELQQSLPSSSSSSSSKSSSVSKAQLAKGAASSSMNSQQSGSIALTSHLLWVVHT